MKTCKGCGESITLFDRLLGTVMSGSDIIEQPTSLPKPGVLEPGDVFHGECAAAYTKGLRKGAESAQSSKKGVTL